MKTKSKNTLLLPIFAFLLILLCIAVYNHPVVRQIRFVRWFTNRPPQYYEEFSFACNRLLDIAIANKEVFTHTIEFHKDKLFIRPEEIEVPDIVPKKYLKIIVVSTNANLISLHYFSEDRGAARINWSHDRDGEGRWKLMTGSGRLLYSRVNSGPALKNQD